MLIARGPDHPVNFTTPNLSYLLDTHNFNKYFRSVTLLENNQHFIDPL
jgi:hypothetical protein